ncbi:MAG: thioredoxin domain-containing protein, partial [Tatlockia sp.]|nr:thioredoxin domain-containing protein [Tatlockia sp.]
MTAKQKANRLLQEPSPYLQQHAYNPVEWFPWGKAAFELAEKENKPILLSIGYAACHWCHVMAHESFEDDSTAKLMNELFVNIKVDKEERPDLDKIYQTAHYVLSQRSGGWPLTIFLTPARVPFFSGTYFPKEEHQQLPAFQRILRLIADYFHQQPDKVKAQALQLEQILQHQQAAEIDQTLSLEPLELGLKALEKSFDPEFGGFGGAPKFPQASRIEFLLLNDSPLAFKMLMQMAKGGIYDQLSGGFYRYSVDQQWAIPHFEKMLYDNGQLLMLYALAGKLYSEPYFNDIARETAEWVLRDLQAPAGGFYSSYDADSEGEEGKFYRWQPQELKKLLSEDEFALLNLYYGLNKAPNFEGYWHFHIAQPLESVCELLAINQKKAQVLLSSAKAKLLAARNLRIPPFRDEKILTSWNSLMAKGLLITGASLKEPRFIAAGQKTLDFIQQNLWKGHCLLASFKDGKAYLGAYLDDYAFLLDSLLTSLEVEWNSQYLAFAIELADRVLDNFADESGGFFFTEKDHEQLLYRPKSMMDEATPSGNGILLRAFSLLGHLLGELRYLNAVEKTLQSVWPILTQYPAEHCNLLLALKAYLNPPLLIVLRGNIKEIKQWQEDINHLARPCFAIPTG